MDPSKLFKTQLSLIKFYGYQLHYKDKWQGYLMKFFAFFAFFSIFVSEIFHFHFVIFNCKTVADFADVTACIVAANEALVKFSVFYFCRDKFSDLFERMTQILMTGDSLSVECVNRIAAVGGKLVKYYFIFCTMTSTSFLIGSIQKNLAEDTRSFPFKGTFFLDIFSSPFFEFFYFTFSWDTYAVGRVYVVMDTLFFSIGSFICEQMKVIQHDLVNIDKGNFNENFRRIVKKHQEILEFCNDFNDVYKPIIIQRFVSIGICISVLIYLVMVVSV